MWNHDYRLMKVEIDDFVVACYRNSIYDATSSSSCFSYNEDPRWCGLMRMFFVTESMGFAGDDATYKGLLFSSRRVLL